jgi:hypothetical protein
MNQCHVWETTGKSSIANEVLCFAFGASNNSFCVLNSLNENRIESVNSDEMGQVIGLAIGLCELVKSMFLFSCKVIVNCFLAPLLPLEVS